MCLWVTNYQITYAASAKAIARDMNHVKHYALLRLLENWRTHLENKEIIGVILCDLSKAFDTLPHDLIIAKLDAYGFGNESLKLIYDYLNNRKQRCKVGSAFSTWMDIETGVPQGSVLGPYCLIYS